MDQRVHAFGHYHYWHTRRANGISRLITLGLDGALMMGTVVIYP